MSDPREQARIDAELTRAGLSNDPFASAVRATRMPMLITDPNLDDNPIVFANDAFSRLTGYSREEILGTNCRFLQGPETDREDVAKIRDAIANRVAIEIDLKNYTKDGRTFWNRLLVSPVFDTDGALIYYFASQYDVTIEREQLQTLSQALADRERTLRELNASLETQIVDRTAELRQYEEIVQASAAPICAFDRDYRLIAFNRAHSDEFFRIFGHRVQVGEVFPELFPPDQAPSMRAFMARALRGEVFTVTEEFGDPTLAKPCWEVSYSPIRGVDGGIRGAFHYAKDISERLRSEAELAETQEFLRQSQKMEAVGQLTGGVAHDFNNLLTVIKSCSDMLKRPDLTVERRNRYVSAIADTVDRAAKLTGQLLAFSRRQALKPVLFDVSESVRGLRDMMGTLSGSRITIKTVLPKEPCFVLADPSQFDTALVNMAVNARDAMDGAGELTVTVEAVDGLPAVRAHPVVAGPHVAVSLGDTGAGIAAGDLERIFEPFFTSKALGKGTGLGLSQVYGFAKQSGGDITVRTEVGKGTTFTLYLKRAASGDEAETMTGPNELRDVRGDARVLVVEDNPEVGTFAVQALADLGYRPALAANAEAALAELAERADQFDVVFTDVVMPGISGLELGKEIRRRHMDMPVVLTSGYSHVLAEEGTSGFELLNKPYSVEDLSRVLQKVTSKRGC